MTDKHEFQPGGRWIDEIPEEDCCARCGQSEAHANHTESDGSAYIDHDSIVARMRADGSIAPSIRERR